MDVVYVCTYVCMCVCLALRACVVWNVHHVATYVCVPRVRVCVCVVHVNVYVQGGLCVLKLFWSCTRAVVASLRSFVIDKLVYVCVNSGSRGNRQLQ